MIRPNIKHALQKEYCVRNNTKAWYKALVNGINTSVNPLLVVNK